jgi:hypothetical protein
MVRWYDWVVALLAADFMLGNIITALTGPIWYIQLVGAVAVYFIYELWIDAYCKFRKKYEYGK